MGEVGAQRGIRQPVTQQPLFISLSGTRERQHVPADVLSVTVVVTKPTPMVVFPVTWHKYNPPLEQLEEQIETLILSRGCMIERTGQYGSLYNVISII